MWIGASRGLTHLPNASREFIGCFSPGREEVLQQFHNLAQARFETAHHVHIHRGLCSLPSAELTFHIRDTV